MAETCKRENGPFKIHSKNIVFCSLTPFVLKQIVLFLFCQKTVIPVYNDHPRDPKIVAVVYRLPLFGGHLCYKRSNWDLKIDRWSLFGAGR